MSAALETLGITMETDTKTCKQRYRELVRQHHPDAGGRAEEMARVTAAHDLLSSLTRAERAEFAQLLRHHAGHAASGRGGMGSAASSSAFSSAPRYTSPHRHRYAYARPGSEASGEDGGERGRTPRSDGGGDPFRRAKDDAFWSFFAQRTGRQTGRTAPRSHAYDPFNAGVFHFGMRPLQRARMMRARQLMMRAVAVYLLVASLILLVFRWFRDRQHEYGWEAATRLSQNEQRRSFFSGGGAAPQQQAMPSTGMESFESVDQAALWRLLRWKEEQRRLAEQNGWPAVPPSSGAVQQPRWHAGGADIAGVLVFIPSAANPHPSLPGSGGSGAVGDSGARSTSSLLVSPYAPSAAAPVIRVVERRE